MQNKVAIVTGASRGIGRETALAFAGAGYDVVLVATSLTALQQLGAEITSRYKQEYLICCGDLSDMSFINSIAEAALEKFGRIDVLVNNAAWRTIETMRNISVETWEKTIRICLTAPAFLAKACAAAMEMRNVRGVIINTSSVMSQAAGGTSPAYIASKGAIESLTKELAVTYGRKNIRVICIRPGYIDTEISNDYKNEEGENVSNLMARELLDRIPEQRPGTASDIASAILWLSSPEAGYITGCEITIDGGLSQNFSSYPIKNLQFPKEY